MEAINGSGHEIEQGAEQPPAVELKPWDCLNCDTRNDPNDPDQFEADDDKTRCFACGADGPAWDEPAEESTMTVSGEGIEPFDATTMTPEQIAAGLSNLSGGLATAQDVENAARAEEGLPPLEAAGLLDFGPFNSDSALKAIFEKSAEVRELQADYERAKEAAKDAKSELDIASKALVNIIESLKNRRTQALNPSQPFLKDVSADNAATGLTGCRWEQDHPGQPCPVCTEARKKALQPAVDSEVHPEHEGHAAVAERARVQNVLEPLRVKLEGVNVFTRIEDLQALSTDDLDALTAYADEPTPMPPHLISRCCMAAEPGTLVQVCKRCDGVLVELVGDAQALPVGAFAGFDCGRAPKIDETPAPVDAAAPAVEAIEDAPRKPKSHAKKNPRKKPAPEAERQAQSAEGKKRSAPKAKAKKAAKGKR